MRLVCLLAVVLVWCLEGLANLLVHRLAKWALHSMVAFLALVQVVVKGALWNVGELAPGLARFYSVVSFELAPAGLLFSPILAPNMFHVPVRGCLIPTGGFGTVLSGLKADDSVPLMRVG